MAPQKIIDKILKLKAMLISKNKNERDNALRLLNLLKLKYKISEEEIEKYTSGDITQRILCSGSLTKKQWVRVLSVIVCESYSCKAIRAGGNYYIIGAENDVERCLKKYNRVMNLILCKSICSNNPNYFYIGAALSLDYPERSKAKKERIKKFLGTMRHKTKSITQTNSRSLRNGYAWGRENLTDSKKSLNFIKVYK